MKRLRTTKKPHLLKIMIAVIIMLAVFNIGASAQVSSTGEKLRNLEESARNLRHENQLLEQELVTSRSLTKLYAQADSLGFVEKPKMFMLSEDASVAHVFDSRVR